MSTLPPQIAELKAKGDPYAFGVLPSKIDLRDHALPPRATPAPASFMHPSVGKVPVRNQQGGTCVGNSIATCLSLMEHAETGAIVPFNGELINARVVAKQYGEGAAMMPRDGLQDIIDHGAAAFAGDQGISMYFPAAYAAVDHTSKDAWKAAISAPQTTVTAACWLQDTFGAPPDGVPIAGYYEPYNTVRPPWGYHELTFVGYDDHGVTVQNSWDRLWGDGGFWRFDWSYVTSDRIGEAWAITDGVDTGGGKVRAWAAPTEPNSGRAVRKGKSAAVYLLESGGRIWVQSLAMAKQMGVDMSRVESLPPTAKEWLAPVIGPDAPVQYQG